MRITVKPLAVLFDLDGTLVDVTALRHYVEGRDKNFDAFHKASVLCPPIQWVINDLYRWEEDGYVIILVTARQRLYDQVTRDWLVKHEVPYDLLEMRDVGDGRPDYEVKSDILKRLTDEYAIRHAYDDNPSTYKLWLEHGIPTTLVPGWDMTIWGHND